MSCGRPSCWGRSGARSRWTAGSSFERWSGSPAWPNCPRYVHRFEKVQASRYVPRAQCETPLAGWKRMDLIQDDLPKSDQGRAEKAGGLLTIEEWFGKVAVGDPEA